MYISTGYGYICGVILKSMLTATKTSSSFDGTAVFVKKTIIDMYDQTNSLTIKY